MGFKQKLAQLTNLPESSLPSSYQIVGDVLLFKLPKIKSITHKKRIAEATKNILPYVRTVCEIKYVSGEFRKPVVKKLIGDSTETIHKENGVLYKLDASKIMFSKGNLSERKRLLDQVKPKEVIVDMFAGIGYFSLNLAKFTNVKKIYSIEKNKTAFGYLKENIKLNKVQSIEPVYGDCRKVKVPEKADRRLFLLEKGKPAGKRKLNYQGIADRVIMGYFPGTDKFLSAAFSFLKNRGIIHYHNIFSKKELWNNPLKVLKKSAKENGFKLEKILEKKIVKDYAPNVYHVVVDAEFRKLE